MATELLGLRVLGKKCWYYLDPRRSK